MNDKRLHLENRYFYMSRRLHADNDSNGTAWYPADFIPICLRVQTYWLNDVILLWDLILFVPNALFVLFLLYKWFRVRLKLQTIDFPILTVFYNLILMVSLLSIIRCVVTIFIKPVTPIGEAVNKIVWLIVRLGQLSTELSVVFFGLFFGRLDSHRSIMRIMYLTVPISLVYISIQGLLEMLYPDKHYVVVDSSNHYYDLYGHGGMIFWFISSTIFAIIYIVIFLLPFTRINRIFPLPTKRSFYVYCLVLAIVCSIQSIGSAMVYESIGDNGLCIIDLTTFLYFTMFGPLVYIVFLRKFFHKESMFPNSYLIENSINNSSSINITNKNEAIQPKRSALFTSPRTYSTTTQHTLAESESTTVDPRLYQSYSSRHAEPNIHQHLHHNSHSNTAALSSASMFSSPVRNTFNAFRDELRRSMLSSNSHQSAGSLVNPSRELLEEAREQPVDEYFVDDDDTKVIILNNNSK